VDVSASMTKTSITTRTMRQSCASRGL
jgi:hypothetical protein